MSGLTLQAICECLQKSTYEKYKNFPKTTVLVSTHIRTWMTAFLLYAPNIPEFDKQLKIEVYEEKKETSDSNIVDNANILGVRFAYFVKYVLWLYLYMKKNNDTSKIRYQLQNIYEAWWGGVNVEILTVNPRQTIYSSNMKKIFESSQINNSKAIDFVGRHFKMLNVSFVEENQPLALYICDADAGESCIRDTREENPLNSMFFFNKNSSSNSSSKKIPCVFTTKEVEELLKGFKLSKDLIKPLFDIELKAEIENDLLKLKEASIVPYAKKSDLKIEECEANCSSEKQFDKEVDASDSYERYKSIEDAQRVDQKIYDACNSKLQPLLTPSAGNKRRRRVPKTQRRGQERKEERSRKRMKRRSRTVTKQR